MIRPASITPVPYFAQVELARRIGATKTAISRLENSSRDVRFSTVERIATALGKTVHLTLKAA
jgi:predicted transcriptional regulator